MKEKHVKRETKAEEYIEDLQSSVDVWSAVVLLP